jgi:toxin FitB
MNIVDSCGWLEYFAAGPNATFFGPAIERPDELLVPSITLLEVHKRVLQQRNEGEALQAVAQMRQGLVCDLDTTIALRAAKLGHELRLPLADSVILATAQLHSATLWTQDADLKGLQGVKYVAAKR